MNRKYSLKRNRDFQYIYRRGKTKGSKIMLMLFLPNRSNTLMVGFCVSKKVGKAVVRNLVKRRLKDLFRQEIPKLKKGVRIVFVAREAIVKSSYKEIQSNMRYLLRKSNLYLEEKS